MKRFQKEAVNKIVIYFRNILTAKEKTNVKATLE